MGSLEIGDERKSDTKRTMFDQVKQSIKNISLHKMLV